MSKRYVDKKNFNLGLLLLKRVVIPSNSAAREMVNHRSRAKHMGYLKKSNQKVTRFSKITKCLRKCGARFYIFGS